MISTLGAVDSPYGIYIFGDQTNSYESDLTQLLHVKGCSVLSSFLEQIHYALRIEISRLPVSRKKYFPRFTSMIDLLARKSDFGSNPALESALLCLTQLSRFIWYHGNGSKVYPSPSNAAVLGLCTGSLAAAAISTSTTVVDLLSPALEAVLIAFRTGLRSTEARDDIEQSSSNSSPVWSVIVGMDETRALKELDIFSVSMGCSRSSRPYLSAINASSVTISGPPKMLDALLQTPPFYSLKPVWLPIHAPYHAIHLYGESDVNAIVEASDKILLGSLATKIPFISTSTGKVISASNYGSLIRVALRDIFIEQLRWDSVLEECGASFEKIDAISKCNIYSIIDHPNTSQSLGASLRRTCIADVNSSNALAENVPDTDHIRPGNAAESKIAIVGYSGRFPDAENNEKFWDLLHEGLDVHRVIPADRFDVKAHFDPTGKEKNTSRVQYGCFIKEPGLFDARFFNMSPREAANSDPGQRLAITTAYEALEMAGFVADRTPSSQSNRVGIFYGMTSDDWREVNSGQNVDTYFIPGGNRAFTPGRINYHFNFSGPSFSIDTACSSSFAAIHTACNSLWKGDCDTAIAGGTNVMTNPDNFAGLDRGHFLSTKGNCNTFDDEASGYCRADAVGTVILKRLEDAEADHDPIYGVLLGAYTNHSAEAVSMTRPDVGAQAFIFDKILKTANVSPLEISYIEMHGTGTQAGDATEMSSVLDVFAKNPRGSTNPLHLGSAKANVGHAESASGVTSLIKVLLMMEHNEIPPHVGIKTKINHNFPKDLKARNVNIALTPTHWKRPEGGKRTVFMNNFSAAGGNTALLMEDAPAPVPKEMQDVRSSHVVAVSAKSIASLQRNIEALMAYIDYTPDLSLPALSYTSTARRNHQSFRAVVTGQDLPVIQQALREVSPCTNLKPVPNKLPDVIFVFTGQGAAYNGMARELFDNVSSFQIDIRRFDNIAQSQGFPSFISLIDDSVSDSRGSSPVITQVGTACMQMALARLWISWGVSPGAVTGHSLGEYAALHIAGVISASDAIYLTGTRAQLLEQCCTADTHVMLAVKSSASSITSHLNGLSCEIACINGPNEIVISGVLNEIDTLSVSLTRLGLKCVKLQVPFAFHSAQVEPILDDFEKAAKGATFEKPAIPYISPLLQGVVKSSEILNSAYLRHACRKTVNFLGGIETARRAGVVSDKTVWIEIGAHPICSGMLKSILGPQAPVLASLRRNGDTWKTVAESTASLHRAGIVINWNEYHRDHEASHEVLKLPTYKWDSKNHWIQYDNNFCLTKGDLATTVTPVPKVSSLSTTSVQKVIRESIGGENSSVVIESDLSDPTLARVVQGHKVNGAALCPSSLYADIALTVGEYLLKVSNKDFEGVGMAVSNMIVEKPLIATGKGAQLFRASASADWKSDEVTISLYSVTAEGKKISDHAHCVVNYASRDEWLKDFKRNAYLIQARIHTLKQGVDEGQSHKIKSAMAYKLFSAIVDYSPSYKGMREVVVDSAQHEATAIVQFQTGEEDGEFCISPYWVDCLGHLAGFVMNASDGIDSKSTVFINHGWESMRCATKLYREKIYRTYVKMQNVGGTLYAGDVYIFDQDAVIAIYQGVKFQSVPRRALDHLLPFGNTTRPAPKLKMSTVITKKSRIQSEILQRAVVQKLEASARETPTLSKRSDLATQALEIVAEEIGLPISELEPSSEFGELGVDSLLSLTTASRLREELEIEVPPSLFADYPTVRDLTEFLRRNDNTAASTRTATTCPSPEHDSDSDGYETDQTGQTDQSDPTESSDPDDINIMASVCCIIAEEIGVPVGELKGSSDFRELGLDSLLSLTMLARLREELDLELPSTLLADNHSLDEVEAALGLKRGPAVGAKMIDPIVISSVIEKTASSIPKATSMLLQGNPKRATQILWLFPDGSGSATSYAPIPQISSDVVVYGMNCPYIKKPQDMKCSLQELTHPYLNEVRRRQPHGPYCLGGWSAGGICAFDAAQELVRCGETVARLILIDSPFPIGLEKLPPRLYDFFSSINLFGSGGPPKWLVPHFLAFIDALDKYRVRPFAAGCGPKTYLVWAKDGVCKNPGDPRPDPRADDPREMKWLLNNRTDFGPNGWDGLLGGGEVVIETLENANHFSLMAGEKAEELARFLERAMR